MFHKAYWKINHIHERAVGIVYKNNVLSFEEWLELDKSFKIHDRDIQLLAVEPFKTKNNLPVTIMNNISRPRAASYSLRYQTDFARPNLNSEHIGINCLRYVASTVWDMVPNDINVNDIESF